MIPPIPCSTACSTTDLTPPKGGFLAGWSSLGGRALTDPPAAPEDEPYGRRGLYATCLIVQGSCAQNTFYLISLDLHSSSAPLLAAITAHIVSTYSALPSNIIMNGTHTHSGPGRYYGNKLYDAMTVAGHNLIWGFDQKMFDFLKNKVIECVDDCHGKLEKGSFELREGKVWGYSSNRSLSAHRRNTVYDTWLTDPELPGYGGLEEKNRRKGKTYLNDEDLHIDPRLRAFVAKDADSDLLGVIGSFSCHGTSNGPHIRHYDPDWFGDAKRMVNETLDLEEDIPVAVMQACCGDICPMPHCGPFGECNDRGERPVSVGEELKTVIGEGVGHELAQIVLAEEDSEDTDIDTATNITTSKTKKRKKGAKEKPSAKKKSKKGFSNEFTISGASEIWDITSSFGSRLSRAQFGLATIAGTASGGNPALYKHMGMGFPSNTLPPSHPQHPKTPLPFPATTYLGWGAPKDIPLTVVLLCENTFIATVPGEPSIATGVQIEKAIKANTSPDAKVIVLGFCGDYAGYWVTADEYDEQMYEGSSMLFGREGVNILTERLVALAKSAWGGAKIFR
ncbi:hypothetical protein TL16_g06582 [Triparma laevis f. inornata]|uniref:Neutral ceramidase n=1 Tax=Triparma laevis f. inornata TaxID=1714386 RepID=A0A9W7EFQ1_9STRA|nr:hypothetical protein TL16_g06582 [Triparma laevis f. inornata]